MEIKIKTEDAVNFFGGWGKGGVQKLAEALGITHGAISQWGEYLPERRALKLYVDTKGAITTVADEPQKAA
ncbi:Cro/CI family transcriptional regulator [Aliamphritea hakodatensis]|uniref:Cro/CI family transcriptional regulator n=1 Tax=Aliamphritea hakodatensis TaxID=2895352 RepID=UPI0022FD6589|nr:Cro/CI family transcriptional regulator [Aliamphritea hakodatensis]